MVADEWTLDGIPAIQPPGVCFTNIKYDSQTRAIYSIGGASCDGGTFYGDQVWRYDIRNKFWTQRCAMCTQTPPPNAAGAPQIGSGLPGLSYHPTRHTFLFHQTYGAGAPADWEYNPSTDTYVKLSTIGGISQTGSIAASYDPVTGVMVVWSNVGLIWQGVLGAWQ